MLVESKCFLHAYTRNGDDTWQRRSRTTIMAVWTEDRINWPARLYSRFADEKLPDYFTLRKNIFGPIQESEKFPNTHFSFPKNFNDRQALSARSIISHNASATTWLSAAVSRFPAIKISHCKRLKNSDNGSVKKNKKVNLKRLRQVKRDLCLT